MVRSDFSILDWAYDKIKDEDEYATEDDIEKKIDSWAKSNARDGGESWFRFKNSIPDWINTSSKDGITLNDFIEEPIDEEALEEVESAKTIKELEKIKTEDEQVLSAIESKRIEIEEIEEQELEK